MLHASQMGKFHFVKNTGVPSVVISPKNDLSMTSDDSREYKVEVFGRRFGGENRGRAFSNLWRRS